ncbi:MAG: glycoside hydrolase family 5 protein [Oscillospiraceae bacterium]|nr:glycoside hydrolase family 5 protein [Oscillospiraceae bacterium]
MLKKAFCLVAVVVIIATAFTSCGVPKSSIDEDMSTMDFVLDMGLGINLGNTMESAWTTGETVTDFETAWGSPVITKEIIQGYADAGFGVIRIPVSWSNMMDEDYTIDKAYINRVKQIVDWVIECGMKAIVNLHADGGWLSNFPTDTEECMKKYEAIWTQVADAFKDYPLDLMFESLNEEGGWDSLWNHYSGSDEGKAESYGILGAINQKFVDIVRASGGKNDIRHLLIAGYQTNIELTCDEAFILPDDPAGRYAISVHYYAPSTFAIITQDASWGEARKTWGTEEDYEYLNWAFDYLYDTYVVNGIPVIVGEYGCTTGNKIPPQYENYISSVCEAVYTRGMCPILWDTTGGFYDRDECVFTDDVILSEFERIKTLDRLTD